MMRLATLVAVLGLTAGSHLRREPTLPEEEAPAADIKKQGTGQLTLDAPHYLPATIANIDNVAESTDSEDQKEYLKPESTEFYKPETTESKEKKDDSVQSYVPKYSTKPLKISQHSVVTKQFCTDMLKNVQEKKAPYYIKGKFSGEARTDLIAQCGTTVCEWTKKYKEAVQTCDICPEDCKGDMSSFFNTLLNDPDAAAPIIKAIIHHAGSTKTQEVHLTVHKTESDVEEPHHEKGYPLPAVDELSEGMDGDGATAGFCKDVLKNIKARKAPYFLDNKYTGECRTILIDQCGEQICGWADIVQAEATRPACSKYLEGLLEVKDAAGATDEKTAPEKEEAAAVAPEKEEAAAAAPEKEDAAAAAPEKEEAAAAAPEKEEEAVAAPEKEEAAAAAPEKEEAAAAPEKEEEAAAAAEPAAEEAAEPAAAVSPLADTTSKAAEPAAEEEAAAAAGRNPTASM